MSDDDAPIVFSTSLRAVRVARYIALLYLWMPVGFFALLSKVEDGLALGDLTPGMTAFVYGILGIAFIGPFIIAWVFYRRVPRNAEDGTLTLHPDRVEYRIGKHEAEVAWSEVGSVHPVLPEFNKTPTALWLAKRDIEALNPSQLHLLRTSMAHRLVTPKQLGGGLLLPLGLFHNDDAKRIVEVARKVLSEYRKISDADGPSG